ncbi:MAG TPA: CopG family transcriptional regulator, partial [Nitrospirales bacterium]
TYVKKTTFYLPDDLWEAVKHAAKQRGLSEAEIIHESITATVGFRHPRPRGDLVASGAGSASRPRMPGRLRRAMIVKTSAPLALQPR